MGDSIIGRNNDGTLNEDYCRWCYTKRDKCRNSMETGSGREIDKQIEIDVY